MHQCRPAGCTTAKLFSAVGKRTPTFLRFSTVGGEKGSADTERDPRGFTLKFYSEEGNWGMVGNNTPVFFIRDGLKFGDFILTQKGDAETNLKSPTMMWDSGRSRRSRCTRSPFCSLTAARRTAIAT